jgi:putative flippase GtrA
MPQRSRVKFAERRSPGPPARAPHIGYALQLARFGIAGTLVFGVYTGGTLLLSGPLKLPIVVAIAVAYIVGVTLHFLLQRHFVFLDRDVFALPLNAQLTRYVVIGVCQYTVTSVAVTTLPHVLGVSQQLVFVGIVVAISLLSFTLLRSVIFHEPRSSGSPG